MVDENTPNNASANNTTPNDSYSSAAASGERTPVDRIAFLQQKTSAIFDRLKAICVEMDDQRLKGMDEYVLTGMLESLNKLECNFVKAHAGLEELNFDSISSDMPGKFDFELLRLRATLQRELSKREPPQHCSTFRMNANESQSVVVMANRSRLPQLELPKFDGAYTEWASFYAMFNSIIGKEAEWASFYAMFNSIIGKEAEITPIEKLQHLRSCLTGAALDTISSLEINQANYAIAINILQKRFDNKRLILQAHIREIFGLGKADASVGKLRELTDKVTAHLRALESIANKEEVADCILVQTLLQKLDKNTQAKWEESSPSNELPSWDKLSTFLEKRCRTLENVQHATQEQDGQVGKSGKVVSTHQRKSFVAANASPSTCVICDGTDHQIYHCKRFENLSPIARHKEAKRLSLCLNCLKKGHQMRDCKSGPCRTCKSNHHTLLHYNRPPNQDSSQSTTTQSTAMIAMSPALPQAFISHTSSDVVLLATAVVLIKNRSGTLVPCRALLDSGSQIHFITTRFANQLQLRKTKSQAAVSGIGDTNFSTEGYSVNLVLKSRTSDFTTSLTAIIAQTITDNQPGMSVSTNNWNIPSNIQLADPSFSVPQRIDLLIGAGLFFELLCVGQIQLAPGLPLLQKTQLGWILSGGGHRTQKLSSFVVSQRSSDGTNTSTRLDDLVRRFWEVEHAFEPISRATTEELQCEEHFKRHYTRLPSGEYSVRLPMKRGLESLGDSYLQAKHRFENLERKLNRNLNLKEKYSAFIKEYLTLKHMSIVPKAEVHKCKYFLPHHCVIKEDSTTTSLRVVFDGSAATTSGFSLNELLMAGPTIQANLFNILIRFRTFPIALTGDICKMYRCIRVTAPDNMLQCILWRDSPDEDIQIYKLDTVTYGTKPAAFLAIRAMHQLAMDESSSYPLGSQVVLKNFYVDDMISGGSSTEEVRDIMHQTTQLLARGNFRLRKWCSNSPDALQDVPEKDKESFLKFDDGSDVTKALGLAWAPHNDMFFLTFAPQIGSGKHTKRSVLATIARCYDPLGLIGPTLTRAKIILQRMWRDKLQWDESLPQSLEASWTGFCKDFANVEHATFPRYVLQSKGSFEIHAFCDASLEAYGACIYVRSLAENGVQVHLLCSKARVAPLKTLTVPKLELCAAALLAHLVAEISKMEPFDCEFHCWSDSSVVLSWLQEEPSKFNIFVVNRICAIQQLTEGMEWHYVPTAMNPADILSKGAAPKELLHSKLWMNGPSFLQQPRCGWPEHCLPESKPPEIRHKVMLSSDRVDISLYFKYINSFGMMQRIFGYVHKFINKIKTPQLTSENIRGGLHLLIRIIQRAQLYPEYNSLEKRRCVDSSSNLASLSPFLDEFGLIRVGGRLRHSTLGFDARHPIILPKDHPLTFAIITHLHRKHHHAGPQSLLGAIRLQFWPIGGMKTVARALRKCIICCRSRPRLIEHIMADLPKERIQDSQAFTVTGVDYCGPFYYKSEVRNKAPQKCYISVFICFATKAVWMELVKDLSTAAFLSALKRFVATRGIPRCIWSDNATNFVGSKNELEDLRLLFLSEKHRDEVHSHCLNHGFDWRFIPPRSPHFGGLWEAAVKMAKQHLYRSMASSLLGFDELRTLVCQIQAIINSRPLVSLSENPEDLGVLTPGHFLIGRPLMAFPEPDLAPINFNRLDRWQRATLVQQLFWKRWSEEYLTLLQQRAKWRTPQRAIRVNDMVCVKDENLPPLKWPLARVIKTISGADGVIRVADLRTNTGTIRRAVNKLCVLPVEDSVESPVLSTGGSMFSAAANNT